MDKFKIFMVFNIKLFECHIEIICIILFMKIMFENNFNFPTFFGCV